MYDSATLTLPAPSVRTQALIQNGGHHRGQVRPLRNDSRQLLSVDQSSLGRGRVQRGEVIISHRTESAYEPAVNFTLGSVLGIGSRIGARSVNVFA
jgi:hypothetical protein